jgi:hypothetical protein
LKYLAIPIQTLQTALNAIPTNVAGGDLQSLVNLTVSTVGVELTQAEIKSVLEARKTDESCNTGNSSTPLSK